VAAVGIALAASVVGLAITTGNSSGVDRQRTVAIAAAESGIDSTLALMSGVAQGQEASFPCIGAQSDQQVWSYPDKVTVKIEIIEYTLTDSSKVLSGCLQDSLTPLIPKPQSVIIESIATLNRAVGTSPAESRTVRSNVTFTAIGNGGVEAAFEYAVFSNSDLVADGHASLQGSPAPTIYARNGMTCKGAWSIGGNVVSPQGGFKAEGSCSVMGNVDVRDDISLVGLAVVQRDATSSDGKLQITGHGRIDGNVTVAKEIILGSGSIGGEQKANVANLHDPALRVLPYISAALAPDDWANFARVPVSSCSELASKINNATEDTVFYGRCKVEISGPATLSLKHDIALLFTGGYLLNGNVDIESSLAVKPNLWMIEPAGEGVQPTGWDGSSCATSNGIEVKGEVAISVPILLYTCTTIKLTSSPVLTGQLYGGKVEGLGSLNSVSMPPLISAGGNGPPAAYVVKDVHKRETPSP
jgi:hypothetical protein